MATLDKRINSLEAEVSRHDTDQGYHLVFQNEATGDYYTLGIDGIHEPMTADEYAAFKAEHNVFLMVNDKPRPSSYTTENTRPM